MTALVAQNSTTETERWRQLITGLGLLLLLGGCVFTFNGALENYQLHVRRTAWPAVEARVVKCNLSGSAYYSSFRHSQGESSFVRCQFAYQADGSLRQNTINIGDSIFTPNEKQIFLASGLTVDKMKEWIARHPPESLQVIHYNPGNPNEIAFPEAEEELSFAPPIQKLRFGLGTAFFGALLVLIGKRKPLK